MPAIEIENRFGNIAMVDAWMLLMIIDQPTPSLLSSSAEG